MVVRFAGVTPKPRTIAKSPAVSGAIIIRILIGSFAFIGIVAADRAKALVRGRQVVGAE